MGGVTRGKSAYDPVGGSFTMGSDTVAAAFREAAADKDVKAILFRVDSPGGSYVASDTIWREAAKAKQAGKIRFAGVTGHLGALTQQEAIRRYPFDFFFPPIQPRTPESL